MMRIFIFIAGLLILISCKKDGINTSPSAGLSTSVDTVKFDTVFTSTGSVTKSFRIYNPNDQRLILSEIKLDGGNTSRFSININGMAVTEAHNIELAAKDSIHIFVKVTIDPTAENLPFIVRDSIRILYNGNTRFVQLQSFGQNAVFLEDTVLTGINVWNNSLPYVLVGNLRIDTNATLNIEPATRIHLDARANFIIDGELNATGTSSQRITFAGSRLDEPYRNFPGSWGGLTFRDTDKSSLLRYCIIKNAYQGITITGGLQASNRLRIEQSVIDNCFDAGIIAISSNLVVSNSLISNCGMNLSLIKGGTYLVEHCTIASYSNSYLDHTKPVLYLSDFLNINGTPSISELNATFINNIIWGSDGMVENEIVTSKAGNVFNFILNNCIYRAMTDPEANIVNCLRNTDPVFDSIDVVNRYFDFHISEFSPAINAGIITSWPLDLDGLNRNVIIPDIGCYEKQ